jgi:Flp pilus assembly protein TadD
MRLLVARRRDEVKLVPTILFESFRHGLRRWGMTVVLASCSLQPAPIERAAMLAEHGRIEDAIRVLEQHLARDPASHDERKLLIRLHGSAGQLDAAMDQTERLVELLPPGSPIPWVELGHAYELAHRYDEALAAYDQAATIAPNDALGPKRGGLRATRWGELRWAEPRLEEAARRAPADAEVWHALGLVRVGLGELDAARQAYMAGLAADPSAIENHLGLATVALRLDEPRAALEQYEALLRARPASTDALLGKSWSLILLGELGDAEAVLMEAQARGADARTIARQRLVMEERKRKLP